MHQIRQDTSERLPIHPHSFVSFSPTFSALTRPCLFSVCRPREPGRYYDDRVAGHHLWASCECMMIAFYTERRMKIEGFFSADRELTTSKSFAVAPPSLFRYRPSIHPPPLSFTYSFLPFCSYSCVLSRYAGGWRRAPAVVCSAHGGQRLPGKATNGQICIQSFDGMCGRQG